MAQDSFLISFRSEVQQPLFVPKIWRQYNVQSLQENYSILILNVHYELSIQFLIVRTCIVQFTPSFHQITNIGCATTFFWRVIIGLLFWITNCLYLLWEVNTFFTQRKHQSTHISTIYLYFWKNLTQILKLRHLLRLYTFKTYLQKMTWWAK